VPVNVEVYQRNEAGDKEAAPLGIVASWNWSATQAVAVGFEFTVTIQATNADVNDVNTQAQETRRALASTFDDSGLFKLGSAKFRVKSINVGSPDEQDMLVKLVCIEQGNAPVLAYEDQSIESDQTRFRNSVLNSAEYIGATKITNDAYNADQRQHEYTE
jgi:hypothetical protein